MATRVEKHWRQNAKLWRSRTRNLLWDGKRIERNECECTITSTHWGRIDINVENSLACWNYEMDVWWLQRKRPFKETYYRKNGKISMKILLTISDLWVYFQFKARRAYCFRIFSIPPQCASPPFPNLPNLAHSAWLAAICCSLKHMSSSVGQKEEWRFLIRFSSRSSSKQTAMWGDTHNT